MSLTVIVTAAVNADIWKDISLRVAEIPLRETTEMEVELRHTPHILWPLGEDEESNRGDDAGRKARKMRNMVMKFNVAASPPYPHLQRPAFVISSSCGDPSYDFHPK